MGEGTGMSTSTVRRYELALSRASGRSIGVVKTVRHGYGIAWHDTPHASLNFPPCALNVIFIETEECLISFEKNPICTTYTSSDF